MTYILDEDSNVWVRQGGGGIRYSDGPVREQRIYDLIASCQDRSVFSSEIANKIGGWASEYHLTSKRHTILRGLDMKPGEKVLELGCGCGAITRYLGEKGLQVTAVEGGLGRARTARLRCADLSNVTVYADDFTQFETSERFDWVLFIGVLEYAPMFNDAADPFEAYIDVARRHMKPDCKVVIAIENKVGLKYWNGAAEDHLRTPYFGINDLYTDSTATTFSKRELTNLMMGYGFSNQEFFYAFPDYKICDTLITQEGELADDFQAHQLLLSGRSRSYGRNHIPSFHDGLAAATLEKAGLLGEMANSFVMVSSAQPFNRKQELAFIHNIGKRHPSFVCETVFTRVDGKITAQKQRLGGFSPKAFFVSGREIVHVTSTEDYLCGETEATSLIRDMQRGAQIPELVRSLSPWMAHLAKQSTSGVEGSNRIEDHKIPGKYVDAHPSNFVRRGADLCLIDAEWQAQEPIPLGWVLVRGVRNLMREAPANMNYTAENFGPMVRAVAATANLTITDRAITKFLKFEKRFRRGAVIGIGQGPDQAADN